MGVPRTKQASESHFGTVAVAGLLAARFLRWGRRAAHAALPSRAGPASSAVQTSEDLTVLHPLKVSAAPSFFEDEDMSFTSDGASGGGGHPASVEHLGIGSRLLDADAAVR